METPRREGGSPWKVVLIGCLGVAVLLGAGVGFLVFKGVRVAGRMAAQMQQPAPPADPKAVAAQFAGIPIYPGAQLDLASTGQMSQMTEAVEKEFGSIGRSAMAGQSHAVYRVSAPPSDIITWYDRSMGGLGWSIQSRAQTRAPSASVAMQQQVYEKGNSALMVMVSNSGSGGSSEMHLMLMGAPAGSAKTP